LIVVVEVVNKRLGLVVEAHVADQLPLAFPSAILVLARVSLLIFVG
jgi:hypothetical protein